MTDYLLPDKTFHLLPAIYDQVGMSAYSVGAAEKYLRYLQQGGWIGRHILEFGCGTGAAAEYLCKMRLSVTAVDSSEEMIAQSRALLDATGFSISLKLDDMRVFSTDREFDLVFSFNTLSYVSSVRHLTTVFQRANAALKTGKLLMFDLWTIRGLATQFSDKTTVLHDDENIFLSVDNEFFYDSYRLKQVYTFFHKTNDEWQRGSETHILRGYPASAVNSMLTRSGFEVRAWLNTDMEDIDPDSDPNGRIVIVAEKVKDIS